MRSIGVAERALALMVQRSLERETFGSLVAQKGLIQDWIAESRIEIDMEANAATMLGQMLHREPQPPRAGRSD